jgi:hypothetical protein
LISSPTSFEAAAHEALGLKIVFSGLVMAWRLAIWPTRRSPFFVPTPTTLGVVRPPSSLTITLGSRPSMIATSCSSFRGRFR